MRILTLLAGAENLDEAEQLTGEIRSFNAEIDFRLRFLHVEIDEAHVVHESVAPRLTERIEHGRVHALANSSALDSAARLALLLDREKPDLLVLVGNGPVMDAGRAAAGATGTRIAVYGHGRGPAGDALDLGETPNEAVEGMTGVAREIG